MGTCRDASCFYRVWVQCQSCEREKALLQAGFRLIISPKTFFCLHAPCVFTLHILIPISTRTSPLQSHSYVSYVSLLAYLNVLLCFTHFKWQWKYFSLAFDCLFCFIHIVLHLLLILTLLKLFIYSDLNVTIKISIYVLMYNNLLKQK